MKKIYLDYNSTTPVDQRVVDEMVPSSTETFGNPSSIHSYGQSAQSGLDMARFHVSQLIGSNIDEIIFTSGGTESNNFALTGLSKIYKNGKNHIITSIIEHSSVYGQCQKLEEQGIEVTYLPVDEYGQVSPADVEAAITENTALISVMLANNEIGTIQKIREISDIATRNRIMLHTDAVQAIGKINVDIDELGVDMMSMSSHKIYGPKGVGALFVRRGIKLEPLLYGGGQETKRRSGTENVPGIIGFGRACEIAKAELASNYEKLITLRDRLQNGILASIPCSKLNGHPSERIPNTLNVSFAGQESDTLVVQLDLDGIAVSSGSACGEAHRVASRILKATGLPANELYSSLRISLGAGITEDDIDTTIERLKAIIK